MGKYDSLEDVRDRVEGHDGVLTMTMEDVRDAKGAGRLGVHVREAISKDLRGLGIGHFPAPLPESQMDEVRLYKLGSPVADLIDAVLHPSAAHDDEIRDWVQGNLAQTLEEIKQLVCR